MENILLVVLTCLFTLFISSLLHKREMNLVSKRHQKRELKAYHLGYSEGSKSVYLYSDAQPEIEIHPAVENVL